jgi:alkylation response protein AidB-like acyl-CoA dehydrogenase
VLIFALEICTGKTFGKTLHSHQAIGTLLAEMAIGVEVSRSVFLSILSESPY